MLYLGTLIALFIFCGKDLARLMVETTEIVKDCLANVFFLIRRVMGVTEPGYRRIIKSAYRKFAVLSMVSVIPTIAASVIGRGLIESASSSLVIIGAGLLVCGTCLMIGELLSNESIQKESVPKKGKTPKHVTYTDALLLGIGQSVALIPGISCFIVTYIVGNWRSLRRDFAIKYSMVLLAQTSCVNVIFGLTKDIVGGIAMLSMITALGKIVGSIILSFIFIRITQLAILKNRLKYLAYFCYGAGVVSIISHIINTIAV